MSKIICRARGLVDVLEIEFHIKHLDIMFEGSNIIPED